MHGENEQRTPSSRRDFAAEGTTFHGPATFQGTFDTIQGTFDTIQGTFDTIQGTFDTPWEN
jgi:hypothetical protein